jgi:hypothetical protein
MKKLAVFFVALVMIFAALPAFAQDKADWAFYGSVRMWTAWESVDDNTPPQLSSQGAVGSFFQNATSKAKAYTIGGTLYDDADLAWVLQSNSRIGANVKWGNVGGAFEYGSGPNLRLLYGTWQFAKDWKLLIGQDYGSYDYRVSGICGPGGAECTGIGLGSIYASRTPQLKLIMSGFKFSLEYPSQAASFRPQTAVPFNAVTPQTVLLNNNQTTAGTGFVETDNTFPRIAASYTFNAGPGQFYVGGQYFTYKEIYAVGGNKLENTVYGWTLGAGTKLAFGPFYTNATVQYGQNPNNAGSGPATLYPSVQLYSSTNDTSEDSTYMAAQLILGYKLTDSITFEGGIIWQNGEVQSPTSDLSFEQNTYTYYLQMTWSPAKNVFIVPEIGIIDYDKLRIQNEPDLNFGDLTWIGIKWQINF